MDSSVLVPKLAQQSRRRPAQFHPEHTSSLNLPRCATRSKKRVNRGRRRVAPPKRLISHFVHRRNRAPILLTRHAPTIDLPARHVGIRPSPMLLNWSSGTARTSSCPNGAPAMVPVGSDLIPMPNRVEALRDRVALYRSYLRVGVRGDCAIRYMRQIADDLDEIEAAQVGEPRSDATVAPIEAD